VDADGNDTGRAPHAESSLGDETTAPGMCRGPIQTRARVPPNRRPADRNVSHRSSRRRDLLPPAMARQPMVRRCRRPQTALSYHTQVKEGAPRSGI
jgi:hypothetical protein